MKIILDIDEKYEKEEIIVRAKEISEKTKEIIEIIKNYEDSFELIGYKDEKMFILKTSEICRIFASNKKVYASIDSNLYEVKYRLYEIEERLTNDFIRISKSEIINLKQVKYFEVGFSGTIVVIFKNKEKSYVSRRYVKAIKERLGI